MANYNSVGRTNYFRVTNEEKYKELYANLCSEGDIIDFTEERKDGLWHGFGSEGSIDYVIKGNDEDEDEEYDIDFFYDEMQKILDPRDAFMWMESGYEKLRYVTGYTIIVTNDEVKCIDMIKEAKNWLKEKKGADFTTRTEY